MSDTLTVSEAATVAGVSVRTMRRWATSGQVRTVGSGQGRRVVAASLSKETAKEDTSGQTCGATLSQQEATTVTETAKSDNAATAAIEADRLAALVSDLSVRLADQAALTAMWQERARVLGDQLALTAPVLQVSGTDTLRATSEAVRPPVPLWLRWWPAAPGVAALLVVVWLAFR